MFKISLEDARELRGLTMDELANHCGMQVEEYRIIENDPGQTILSLMLKISSFLGLPLELVFPGNKLDCLNYNRSQSIIKKSCSHIAHAIK